MLILVARYTLVFWLVFGQSDAEKIMLHRIAEFDEGIFRLSSCTARCLLVSNSPQNIEKEFPYMHHSEISRLMKNHALSTSHMLKNCFNDCHANGTDSHENVRKIQENFYLQLVCRDDRSLAFRIDMKRSVADESARVASDRRLNVDALMPHSENVTESQRKIGNGKTLSKDNVIFFVRINSAEDAENFQVYLTDDNVFTIGNLTQDSSYNITAVAVHASGDYSIITKMQQFRTLRKGFMPGMVSDIRVLNYTPMSKDRLIANIVWKPPPDKTCHYNIISYSTENSEYEFVPLEIRNPRELYRYTMANITFSKEYRVGIRAKNSFKETELFWLTFRAPSCMEYYKNDLNICPPKEPEELYVEKAYISDNEYSLNITWRTPDLLPDYYTLRIVDMSLGGQPLAMNVSNLENNVFIENITLRGFLYEIYLYAFTPGGRSFARIGDYTQVQIVVPDKNHRAKLISAILAPIFFIVLLCVATFIICHRRAKLKRYQERCKYFEELEKKAPIDPKAFDFPSKNLPLLTSAEEIKQFQLDLEEKIFFSNDAMEIERNDVDLQELLGEGAFGLVRRGVYHNRKSGESQEVAVKMLKEQPSVDDVCAFRREIEVMKSVESHPNIVGIIGHCTKHYSEMLLLTEYCSLGNLLDFLRDEWKYLHELQQKSIFKKNILSNSTTTTINDTKSTNPTSKLAAINKSYGYDEICTNSCKCQVDVVMKRNETNNDNDDNYDNYDDDDNDENDDFNGSKDKKRATIAIKDCECQQRQKRLVKNNQRNAFQTNSVSINEMANSTWTSTPISTPTSPPPPPPTHSTHSTQPQPQPLPENSIRKSTTIAQLSIDNKAYFKCSKDEEEEDYQKHENQENEQQQNIKATADFNIQRIPLNPYDLLDIAKQVATGMEFLAKNKVVHRDLAARNVLVATDRTIKIADFGLSRDVYLSNIYKKTGNGKLPIKWLAIESMTHQVYTTQSDVWSFGILLYELITLGGSPYPGIPTNRLLHMLKTGYRMDRPKNCSPEFYALMASCWFANPGERPTFTKIIKILEDFMCGEQQTPPIDTSIVASIKSSEKKKIVKPTNSLPEDAYLKPL